ncbi:MAG: baseplate J/gp47 family protein [Roseobacter sp.]
MSGKDLTRWNRAGLRRFRYVDGNAVTHLETLRARLAEAYVSPGENLPRWSDLVTRHPVPASESPAAREARLTAQYQDTRRDHAWEILRSFARSTHVLTEHIDAYANETFIGTATQWESIRRLVQLLDARPAPPASAQTDLALIAKETGVLAQGFQVKNVPDDGSAPSIFETASDLAVDPALNLLRPTAWDKSQEAFLYAAQPDGHLASFPLGEADKAPVVGEIAVLEVASASASGSPNGFGVQVAQDLGAQVMLLGQPTNDRADLAAKRWQVSLHRAAELVQTPRLAGPDVVILTPEHNLSAGRSSITWYDGGWKSGRVMQVDGARVRLDADHIPQPGEAIYLMVTASRQSAGGIDRVIVPAERGGGARVWSPNYTDSTGILEPENVVGADGETFVAYQFVTATDALLYVPAGSEPVAYVEETAPTGLVLGGTVKDLGQGDWIVSASSVLQAVRVDAVTVEDGDTLIETTPLVSNLQAPVHLKFAETLRPIAHDKNHDPAFDTDNRSDQVTRLICAPEPWPNALARGRQVIIETAGLAHSAVVAAVDAAAGWIEVAPPVPGTEATGPVAAPPLARWNTHIRANVVLADHGESQPRKILGSGDATQSGQVFDVNVDALSFVADPLMPAGVRASIDIEVGNRTWRQVGNLRDSGPTDADFEVRLNDDQDASVHFGDGKNGRRLPTDTDNIRYRWRKGVGVKGNLKAGALRKIVRPDPLIDAVVQPLSAGGGADAEELASLRDNAASGLLTLGRAVSVSDFGRLAALNAQVLQAVSFQMPNGAARGERIGVIIVPAGGRMGTLGDDLQQFLQSNALPGVSIDVQGFVSLPLSLKATLRVDLSAYDPDQVTQAVRAALTDHYALERAKLGAPLFRSQLLHLIEGVEGVENASVEIEVGRWAAISPPPLLNRSPGLSVRSIKPRRDQMIHVDPDLSVLTLETEPFTL